MLLRKSRVFSLSYILTASFISCSVNLGIESELKLYHGKHLGERKRKIKNGGLEFITWAGGRKEVSLRPETCVVRFGICVYDFTVDITIIMANITIDFLVVDL